MIIGAYKPLIIGQRYVGLTDAERRPHRQPFVVLRPATLEEWRTEALADGMTVAEAYKPHRTGSLYYEVSVD